MDLNMAITFSKQGARPFSTKRPKPNLLQTAMSWEMRVDLGRRPQFPKALHLHNVLVLAKDHDSAMEEGM